MFSFSINAKEVALLESDWMEATTCQSCGFCGDQATDVIQQEKELSFYCDELLLGSWKISKHLVQACDSTFYSYSSPTVSYFSSPHLSLLLHHVYLDVRNTCEGENLPYFLSVRSDLEDQTIKRHFMAYFVPRTVDLNQLPEETIYEPDALDTKPYVTTCSDIVEEEARDACSTKELSYALYPTVNYPIAARELGIAGTVYIGIIVDKNGDIQNIELLRDVAGGCGEAAYNSAVAMTANQIKFVPGL